MRTGASLSWRAAAAVSAHPSVRAVGLACALLALAPAGGADEPTSELPGPSSPGLAEVLVTGQQPGPGMWRVSAGRHELWILGTLEPLPKKMTWHSRQADTAIAHSQELLSPPAVSVSVGFFKGLTALPTLLRARKNPDGRTLRDVLPADVYVRWSALKVRFIGADDGVERLRPSVAAHELYKRALDRSGLSEGDSVWGLVEKSAKLHHVPVTAVTVSLTLDDPKATIRQLEQIPRDADVGCLASTIEHLETDLGPIRERAILWSFGDVDGLRRMSYKDQSAACFDALNSVPELRVRVLQLRDALVERWMSAAGHALATNDSTFAVLPMSQMLEPAGWVARLRARGYQVDEP